MMLKFMFFQKVTKFWPNLLVALCMKNPTVNFYFYVSSLRHWLKYCLISQMLSGFWEPFPFQDHKTIKFYFAIILYIWFIVVFFSFILLHSSSFLHYKGLPCGRQNRLFIRVKLLVFPNSMPTVIQYIM